MSSRSHKRILPLSSAILLTGSILSGVAWINVGSALVLLAILGFYMPIVSKFRPDLINHIIVMWERFPDVVHWGLVTLGIFWVACLLNIAPRYRPEIKFVPR